LQRRLTNLTIWEELELQKNSLAQAAGLVGMAGPLFWLVSVFMQASLGITKPAGGVLFEVHELFAFLGLLGAAIGFLGLLWAGAFRGRLGTIAVTVTVLGFAFILVAGGIQSVLQDEANPIFLLFPLGGLLQALGAILLVIAAIAGSRWNGWQRWMPLVYGLFYIFGVLLPSLVGVTQDGPGAF
jgi:hypothetical protein